MVEARQARQDIMTLKPVVPNVVGIVGAGGIGSYIGQCCALAGVKKLVVFDTDTLELTNLNRLPYPKEWVGRKKTDCLNDYINIIMGSMDTEFIPRENIDSDEDMWILEGCEFVFITADRGAARNLVTRYCKSHDIPFINVGYDGNNMSCYRNFRSSSEQEEPDEGGYTVTPSWAAPTMMIAGVAMYFMAYPRINRPFSANVMNLLGSPEKHKCEVCGFQSEDFWQLEGHLIPCTACRTDFHTAADFNKHQAFRCTCGFKSCKERIFKCHVTSMGIENINEHQLVKEA